MNERPLFVRWSVLTMVSGTLLGILVWLYGGRVHGAPLAVVGVVLAVTGLVSGYAGWLAWRADDLIEGGAEDLWLAHDRVTHDAKHVSLTVYLCQVLAAVGALVGVYLTVKAHPTTPAEAATSITSAMANGLAATIVGVLCSIVLVLQHHLIVHAVERP